MNRVLLAETEYDQTLGGAIIIERLLAKYRCIGLSGSDEMVIAQAVHAMRLKLPEKIVRTVFWFLV